jgi:hypothetical protein
MLLYHPAFDTYHSAFRLLLLMWNSDDRETHYARLRILDFYLLFPAELESMSFPRNMIREKSRWKKLRSRYNQITDPRRVFDELASFQLSGMQTLLSTGLASQKGQSDVVSLLREALPAQLVRELESATAARTELLRLLTGPFKTIDLYGQNGLKARTGFFEYRYDPV